MLLFRLETWDRRSVQEVLYLRYMRSAPAKMGMLEHIDLPGILYRVLYCTGYIDCTGHIDVPGVPGVLGVPRQGVPGDPMLTVDDVRSTRPQVTFALQTLVTTRGRY